MRRTLMLILGVCLFVLWIVEVQLPGATSGVALEESYSDAKAWITWLDLMAALGAVFAAAPIILRTTRWASFLSAGLLILGIVGLTSTAPAWMGWWNLGFAAAFFAVAVAGDKLGPVNAALPKKKDPLPRRDHTRAA